MAEENPVEVKKKTYLKPQVTEVRLVAGEAVLGFCKNGSGNIQLCQPADPQCGINNNSARS